MINMSFRNSHTKPKWSEEQINFENLPPEHKTFTNEELYSFMYVWVCNEHAKMFNWGEPIRVTFQNGSVFEYRLPNPWENISKD